MAFWSKGFTEIILVTADQKLDINIGEERINFWV
jgi:hypothetical protein